MDDGSARDSPERSEGEGAVPFRIGNAGAVSEENSGSGYVEAEYKRDSTYIQDRITADGAGGWPVEPNRYRLVVARACPWANRAVIVRRLLGLEPVISMGMCGPTHDKR